MPLEPPVRNPFDVSEPGLQALPAEYLYCRNFPSRRAGTLISTLNAPTHESKHSRVRHLRFASPVNNYISCIVTIGGQQYGHLPFPTACYV